MSLSGPYQDPFPSVPMAFARSLLISRTTTTSCTKKVTGPHWTPSIIVTKSEMKRIQHMFLQMSPTLHSYSSSQAHSLYKQQAMF